MTPTPRYAAHAAHAARAARAGLAALLAGVLLAACGGSEIVSGTTGSTPPPTTKAKAPSPTTAKGKATAAKSASAPPTTSTLGPFPPVLSSSPSGIAAGAVRSAADLPAAFQCPAAPAPIVIPGDGGAPDATVCQSKLAGEALYLWFVDTPDARYRALHAALGTARYVHGGPTWVAGGTVDPAMGTVGGDVYK